MHKESEKNSESSNMFKMETRNEKWRISRLMTVLIASVLLIGCQNQSNSTTSSFSSESVSSSKEIDMASFPNYVGDIHNLNYSYGTKQMTDPYWWGNVIYNESALMISTGSEIAARLAYAPTRIISVRDYTLKKEYVEGTDYTISGNKLLWKEGSAITYWTNDQIHGLADFPSPYVKKESITNTLTDYVSWNGVSVYTESPIFYGTQIYVTYAYDIANLDLTLFPSYSLDDLPHVKAKLESKNAVAVSVLGDSISEGCSASLKFNHEPFQPDFFDLFTEELGARFGSKITANNLSVGGKTSDWGSEDAQINALIASAPDLALIHFGINDLGAGSSASHYYDNMEKIILSLNSKLPNCDIIVFCPFAPHPDIYDFDRFDKYVDKIHLLSTNYGCKVINLFALSRLLNQKKDFYDATANGINHPNDFGHRLYAQALLANFVKIK